MLHSTKKGPDLIFVLVIMLCSSLIVAGCGVLQNVSQPAGGDEDEFDTIDLSGEDGDSDDPDGDFSSDDSELPPPAYGICPPNPMAMFLVVNHTWDYSPNRDLATMRVDGKTAPFIPCSLSVHGSKVTMEKCVFPFTNTGYMNTDAGRCDIKASGDAILSVEQAYCKDGKITLTIIETIDTDGGTSGTLSCPNKLPTPFVPFYPYSLTTRTFAIVMGGFEQSDDKNPDLTGQYRYNKIWTLHSIDLPMPENED